VARRGYRNPNPSVNPLVRYTDTDEFVPFSTSVLGLVRDGILTYAEAHVHAVCWKHSRKGASLPMASRLIALETGLSRTTVKKAISHLLKLKLFREHPRSGPLKSRRFYAFSFKLAAAPDE
jgi:hypothetical protein